MIFPATMKHLTAVVLSEHADAVTRTLLAGGALHTVDVEDLTEVSSKQLEHRSTDEDDRRISETRGRIENFLSIVDITPSAATRLDIANYSPVDLDEVNRDLDKLSGELQRLRNNQRDIQSEINRLRDIQRHLSTYGDLQRGLSQSGERTFLTIQAGSVPRGRRAEVESDLQAMPSVVVDVPAPEDRDGVVVVGLQRNQREIEKTLDRHEFEPLPTLDSTPELDQHAQQDVERKIAELKDKQRAENRKLLDVIKQRKADLLESWGNLRMNELYAELRSHFSYTDHTVMLSGWVPADRADDLETRIRTATDGRCYVEWHNAKEVQEQSKRGIKAPVALRNPKILRPFQMLVVNFAVPDYGTIDPTPFVAVTYLAMFGLMFQDVGHGLVLAVAGILGLWLTRSKNANGDSPESGVRSLLRLGIWCGGASIVTGVLFGSYFGMQWLPPLWFDYHGIVAGHGGSGVYNSIFDILNLTIYLGITVIGVGLVLNWVNSVSKRRWIDLVFDKGGLLAGLMYGAGVALAFDFAAGGYRTLSAGPLLAALIVIPAVLLFFKAPLVHRSRRAGDAAEPVRISTVLWFGMEWIIELLEIFSGYLANTLSFMRVAGLGIAHVTLMIAFFQIAEMAGPSESYSVAGIFILVLGNGLVIALEGLSAGIQSLRLNYYEFFSKYFNGTGEVYRPVTLRASR